MKCASCGTDNDAANRFCRECGATMAETPTCRSCGTRMAAGARFCTSCGTAVAAAPEVPQGPGYVVDGEWVRAPGELVHLVPGEAMRSAFGRLLPNVDWAGFLRGTLVGGLVDAMLSRCIRVPMDSVGAVTRDGRVVKVLPPGEQTTPGVIRDVLGDLGSATGAALDKLLRPQRVSLYLVDRRPVPVSFTAEQGTATGLRTLQITTLVTVGTHPDALTAFLTDVVGDRDTLAAEDLYVRFRGEIEQAATDALRSGVPLPQAERKAREVLQARFGARCGLSFEPRDRAAQQRAPARRGARRGGGGRGGVPVVRAGCGRGSASARAAARRSRRSTCRTACSPPTARRSSSISRCRCRATGRRRRRPSCCARRRRGGCGSGRGPRCSARPGSTRWRPCSARRRARRCRRWRTGCSGSTSSTCARPGSSGCSGRGRRSRRRSPVPRRRARVARRARRRDRAAGAVVGRGGEGPARRARRGVPGARGRPGRRAAPRCGRAGRAELARGQAEAEHDDAMAADARGHARRAGRAAPAELDRSQAQLDSELRRQRAEDEAHADKLRRRRGWPSCRP
ncbi:MAG: zinc ribbon domain-containing protein [Myxococcota bacterium]